MTKGRIIKGVGGSYSVATEQGLYICNVRGIFRKQNITPTIGDFVEIDMLDNVKRTGTISRFEKRKNRLLRPRVSNIDQAIIVFAAQSPDINLDLLDRFLLLAEEQNLDILICINKIDLTDSYILIGNMYKKIGYSVVEVSSKQNFGLDKLKSFLTNKASVLAGPSGAGKSSLINAIIPEAKMEVGELSIKIGRGKHTTRHAELICVTEGTYVLDSPGFTSLNLEHISPGDLACYFKEFRNYLGECRFNDCMHLNEPECAVKAQVGTSIELERYARYVALYNELSNVKR